MMSIGMLQGPESIEIRSIFCIFSMNSFDFSTNFVRNWMEFELKEMESIGPGVKMAKRST